MITEPYSKFMICVKHDLLTIMFYMYRYHHQNERVVFPSPLFYLGKEGFANCESK